MVAMGGQRMTWCFGRTMRGNLFCRTTLTSPSILVALVARDSLPALPLTTAMRYVDHRSEGCAIVPTLAPWKFPPFGNQKACSPSRLESVLFLLLSVTQVWLRRGSVSHGTKGNVHPPGRGHTSTFAHHVKLVTQPNTALLLLQTHPSSN